MLLCLSHHLLACTVNVTLDLSISPLFHVHCLLVMCPWWGSTVWLAFPWRPGPSNVGGEEPSIWIFPADQFPDLWHSGEEPVWFQDETLTSLSGVNWNFSVVLDYISLMARDIEYFFSYLLALCNSSEKCLCISAEHFLTGSFIVYVGVIFIYWLLYCRC